MTDAAPLPLPQATIWGGSQPHTPVDRMKFHGNFCNLYDSHGRIIYTPALPGAPPDIYAEWTAILRASGTTHIPFGPPKGGEAYPGIGFENPDFWNDLPALRRFIERLISDGFCPVLFVGADTFAESRFDRWWNLAVVLAGLHEKLIVVPAWEPVVGGWTSRQVSDATIELHRLFPSAVLGWHFSPGRWSMSSNPIEPDDPWQGGESECWKSHGGEFVDLALPQLPHGPAIYSGPCNPDDDDCWLNRWQDGVMRCGAGYHGWRIVHVVAYETVAYEAFRVPSGDVDGQRRMSLAAREIASQMKSVADLHGVTVGYGNGLPL